MIVTEVFRRSLDTNNHTAVARALLIINALLIGSIAAFALAGNLWIAVGAFWIISLLRSVNSPLYSAWLNQNLDSASRATVLSMGSQFDALGQFMGGPIIGLVATSFSIPAGLLVSAVILSPVLLLYLLTLRRSNEPSPVGRMKEEG
jgi:DHA3 family tetracycline resistance protein-like MFS transporter